jgi:hypothetical protein
VDPPALRARELANCDPAEENRIFELVCGIPRVETAALENRRLAWEAGIDSAPRTDPARAKSAEVARTILARVAAMRPKSAVRMPATAFATRALRYMAAMFALPTMAARPSPTAPTPYHGWNASNGASATHPTLPNPKPNPIPNPIPGPQPKNPTSAGE